MLRLGRAAAAAGGRALGGSRLWGAGGCSRRSSSAGKEILVNVHGGERSGLADIVMNRPHARNSLGKTLVNELFRVLESLRYDESIRVVVFKSEVKGVFCAGADLKERAQMSDSEVGHFVHRLRSLMDEIAALPVPTIAAIDGYALGGGLELALACDLRVAASSAKMGLIETTRGLLPGAGGTQRLPRCIGIGLAKELIFTGRQIDGQQALSIGLVNHAVLQNDAGDAAYRRALTLAEEILPRAPIAVKMGKLAINRGTEGQHPCKIDSVRVNKIDRLAEQVSDSMLAVNIAKVDIASGMAIEGMCYARNISTKDRQEGMAAFIEKRPPQYIGK